MKDAITLLLCAVALAQGFNLNPEQRSRPCNCDPSEAQQICQANYDNDDVLIAHENCNQFYKCTNGKPVAYYCPDILLYDPLAETCEWPYNVECGDRPISEGPAREDDSESEDVSDNDNDGTCNCNPSEAPSICAAEGSNGILVAHQNCNKFYKCAEGKPVAFECAPTLLYNPYTEACDWPQNVECDDRVIPDPGDGNSSEDDNTTENDGSCNCNPEEAPAICAAPGSESELIAHEDCNKYYICNHGIPVAVPCFGDLLYNPYTKQCDWPRNVDCGNRLVPDTECTGCNDNTSDSSCDGETESPPSDSEPEDSDSSDVLPPGDDVVVPTRPPGTCNCKPEEASGICATEGSDGVLVAHENCNQFYKCVHGQPVVLSCHGDLLYNPYTEKCDWPENVDCGDRAIPDPDQSVSTPGVTNAPSTTSGATTPGNNCDPNEAPAICAADDSDGILVAHENCNQFYKCSEGKPVALTCPAGLLFNPVKDQCDWPENVDCGDRAIPDPDQSVSTPGVTNAPGTTPGATTPGNNCDPNEAPAICAADDSDGILVAHENCNQFYKCSEGKPVALTCPAGLLFNPVKDQCDWPENVDCGDRVIPDPDQSVSTPGVTNAPGTTPGATTPGNNCDPNEAPAICAADDSDGILVAHENCNQFYKCSEGKPVALTCPAGLLFNPAKDQCDWPFNVDCGDRVIPDPGASTVPPPGDDVVDPTRPPGTCNCKPEEAPGICAAEDSDGVLVAHENCNQFYKCDHGKPVALECYGNLLYNPFTEQCDWPENVDCGDRVTPDPDQTVSTPAVTNSPGTTPGATIPGNNCDPSEAPAICAAEDSDGVLVAHENCNQFYKCSEGKPVALTCPAGLLFNPAKDQCDWPFNVDCGDRVIPDPGASTVPPPGDDVVDPTRPPGTCNCKPEEAPGICAAEDSDGVLVAHENCNQFYKCDHGKPVALKCYGNLLYNPYTEQCDWPENVDCGDRVIPDPESSEEVPPGDDVVDPTRPPGTCNCKPEEAPGICAAEDSDGVLVAHENCNQFYKCDHGKPVALKCYGNLLYNPYTEKCDWPENVDCGDRVTPDPDQTVSTPGVTNPGVTNPPGDTTPGNNCDPNEAPTICAAEDSEGVLVAHENCNQFYVCNEGKPVVLTCPADLLFNPAKDQCDWPFNVDCGDRVIPDPGASTVPPPGDDVVDPTRPPGTCNCKPEEAPGICAAEDSDGVLVAHENCNQFYKCDHGKPVALKCYGNLLYNPYTEQCDWPENVDCGDRVTPDPDQTVSTPGVTNPGVTNPGVTNPPGDTTPGNNCDPNEAPTICAAEDSEGVLVAHENCNQFYVCNGGKPVVLTCPAGLLFNPAKDQCDWPFNVDCGDRVIPDPGASTVPPPGDDVVDPTRPPGTCNCKPEEAPGICAAEDSDGVLVAHENCNQFYKCDHGKPVAFKCYGNLLYNPYTEQCDWPENVDCGDRVIPDPESSEEVPPGDDVVDPTRPPGTCNCKPEEAPGICAAEDSDGVLVAHENCNQFYKCDHGKPVALKCYGNLLYNPYTEQCDWPENVDCGDRVTPDPDQTVSTPGVTNPGVTNPPGDTTPGNNCDPNEAPTICAAEDSEGVLVAHENCNQFYVCNGGKPVVLTCPAGLLFNPAKDQCDWPFNVDCGDRIIPDPGATTVPPPGDDVVDPTRPPGTCNCKPEEAPGICAAEDSDGVLVAHENCNQFYKCDHGKPVALKCYGNLLYNPYTEQCDWPENVDCGDRVIPDPESSEEVPPGDDVVDPTRPPGTCNCKPEEAPGICAAEDSDGVLVAHENCNQFYKCDHGKPVALKCYGNLLYNPYTEKCDWPENVECGDRVTPDPEQTVSTPGVTNPGVTNPAGDTTPGNNCDPNEAPTICAAEDSEGVLVAHENCNQFYVCNGGKPVVLTCPNGLLFNPAKDECDWPFNVDCGDRVIPDPGASTVPPPGDDVVDPTRPPGTCNCKPEEAPGICAAEDSDGVLVAHENCNQFYKCDHGKPVALKCYGNLLYNPYTEQCDWPENVDCGDRVTPNPNQTESTPDVSLPDVTKPPGTTPGATTPGNNCDPSEAPAICAAEDSDGVLVAHENCNQFYKCSEGKPVALSCPDDLLFNPAKDQCDWPFNVDCGDRVIPDSDSESSEIPPPGDDITSRPTVADSNETDDCSGNSDENSGQCNCDPDQAPSICAVNNSDGVLIAHEYCDHFYICDNGKPVALKCPANTLFDPFYQGCNWAHFVNCGDRIIPDPKDEASESKEEESEEEEIVGPCNCNPEEAPAICKIPGSSGVQIAHENCNQFYICDHGGPVAFSCNGFLLYDPVTERCDWPANVECGDRVIPNPGVTTPASNENDSETEGDNIVNDDPSQAPAICAGVGSDGVLVAHENCDQYYICAGSRPVAQPCNEGLLFNPNNQRCDWPSNVVCGDRITPDDCACNPRNAPALCAKPGSQGKLIAHENCNQFYICAHSVPVAQTCPAGLFYNPDNEWCDWPRNVKCDNRIQSFASLNKHSLSRQNLRN